MFAWTGRDHLRFGVEVGELGGEMALIPGRHREFRFQRPALFVGRRGVSQPDDPVGDVGLTRQILRGPHQPGETVPPAPRVAPYP